MKIYILFSKLYKQILEKSTLYILSIFYKDIELGRKLYAIKDTVNYIENYMHYVPSMNSREKLLDFAIDNISIHNGLVLEFGVYTGTSINFLSKKLKNFKIYGFDSFDGLPEFWRDGFNKGTFAMNNPPSVSNNVTLVKGWFDESLPSFIESNPNFYISFLHIDCDLYSSTKSIFSFLENNITKGTVIVFDEYFNYPGWRHGEFKAFQEFISMTNKEYKYLTFNSKQEQVALLITKG
jgi:hypothetical protein